jgi:PilZ domain-containing protein
MNMEHRCGYRRPISAGIVIRTSNGLAASGRLCDISASGALIASHLPAPVHAQVLVQFTERQKSRRSAAVIRGEIVRHAPGGFAIEWSEFSPPLVRALLRQVAGEGAAAPRATTRAG